MRSAVALLDHSGVQVAVWIQKQTLKTSVLTFITTYQHAAPQSSLIGPLPRQIDPKIKFSNIVQTRRNLESIVVYGTGNRLEPMQTRTARVSRIRKLHLWGSPRAANGQKRPKCESAPASHGRGGGFFRRRIGCRHGGDGCHRCRHSIQLDWSRGRPPTNREGCRLRPTMSR